MKLLCATLAALSVWVFLAGGFDFWSLVFGALVTLKFIALALYNDEGYYDPENYRGGF